MAIARVASQSATGINTGANAFVTVTWPATPTAGNLLVAAGYSSLQKSTLSMSAGWVQADSVDDLNGHSCSVWYKVAGAGEATTVTLTSTASGSVHMALSEYNGFTGTPTLDKHVTATSGSASVNSLAVGPTGTTAAAAELLIVGAGVAGSGASPTYTASFTTVNNTTRVFMGQQVVAAVSSYSTTFGYTGTAANVNAVIATFQDAAAAAAGIPLLVMARPY